MEDQSFALEGWGESVGRQLGHRGKRGPAGDLDEEVFRIAPLSIPRIEKSLITSEIYFEVLWAALHSLFLAWNSLPS